MKGVIKNMKEQFLNLSGLTELVTYIKLCIAQHKMIIPRASFSLFPKTGDENNIYIDTSTNSIYRWNDSDKSFVLLARPPRNISISEGKNNGQITLKVDEIESNATVHGLKSAAFSNASSFATSAQGAKADSAVQSITIAPGTNNGTVKITVNGVTTDNIKVAGLGSAAFSDIAVFAPAKHTHSKSDVGLGNVDNTADIDKSVKYAGSSGNSNTIVYTALTNTNLNTLQTEGKWYYAGGGNTCTNVPVESAAFELYVGRNASGWRYQQFTVTSGEIYIRVFDSSNWGNWRKLAFTSDTVTAASSVPWSGITGKPTTFTPASHTHNYVVGSYTGNGGQQKPNYFGTNKVGFLMMNTTVNGDSNYKDWIIMDCYGGNDVGGSVALGVNRQKLAAYIMRSAAERSSWAESAELLHTLNYTSYTVTKTGTGASGTWGISISGNATTSTKLATARSINGTNFDGSGNITTATWGTARTLTIGNTGKSVNGGGNVSWSLSEIGAAASNHTHSYLPLSGGAMTGNISYRGSKATYKMIEFIDNSSDEYGNGIAIGGGGLTIIGGGESADVVKSTSTRGGDERLILANDGAIDIYTNCQNGIDKATHITIDNTGLYSGTAAKANSVPWSGVTGKPSTYTPSSHNHTVIQGTSSTSAVPGKANDGFCEFYYNVNNGLANNMPSSNNANAIISISRHAGDYTSQLGFSSNGNLYYREGVGATAWKTILTSSNYTSYTVTKTGGGASGTWGINITGSSGSCTGNAATASNASKVNGHTVNSDVPSGAKFTDTNTWRPLGTAANTACAGNDSRLSNSRPASDVYSWAKASSKPSYSWSEITSKPSTFTPASHTHAYIPLSGGTITGSIIRSSGGSWISARNNVAVRGTATGKDSWNPVVGQATPNGYWTIGNLASNDNLAFSYTSNTNYNAGNNSATTVYLPVQEGTIITSATIGSQSVKYATSAGSAGSVAWGNVSGKPSNYTPSSHTHDDRYYTETEINTKLGAKLGAVSANGYYGMARPDGNTSDWIRTTTAGIIPYQSGGAGAGHCGIGTSSWYFSNAYIDTVNCVNASVSGHIDVGGYIQSSNLITTYFEYQSNRGTIDWRFGAATGTGDENFFGFYDAKTGKIPLALDGNFGNIYVGFNVGSYESPTAVGVYLGGQVAGNRAFIYNGDSYQGSIWIQTRLDGSWKWFSLGRVCSTALSDIRLKGNIRDTEVEDATKVIESMKIRSFERKDSHKKYKIGFIADELEQLDPNLIDGGGEVDGHPDYKSVNNLQMLAYVVKGMQELNSKVTILEQENKRLNQKLNMCN